MTRAARAVAAAWPAMLLALATPACDRLATNLGGGVSPESGVLRGKKPVEERGVSHVKRLTDGIAAVIGDPSRTDLTAAFSGTEPFATWDLGSEVPVRCALLDADGDDRYTLSLSADGRTFAPLWTAEPDEDPGQQLRAGRDLKGTGRYLRLSPSGGDGRFSVAEVSAWTDCPSSWPPLAMQGGDPDEFELRSKLHFFVPVAFAYLVFYRRRWPDWAKLLGVVPAGLGISFLIQLEESWPPSRKLMLGLCGAGFSLLVAVVARVYNARHERARSAASEPPSTS